MPTQTPKTALGAADQGVPNSRNAPITFEKTDYNCLGRQAGRQAGIVLKSESVSAICNNSIILIFYTVMVASVIVAGDHVNSLVTAVIH